MALSIEEHALYLFDGLLLLGISLLKSFQNFNLLFLKLFRLFYLFVDLFRLGTQDIAFVIRNHVEAICLTLHDLQPRCLCLDVLFKSAFLYSFKISFILLVSLFSQNNVFLFDHRRSLLLLIFQKRLLDPCIFFLFFCKLHDFLGSKKGGLFLLEYSLNKFILLDFLLDHIVSLFASFLDSLNGFGLLFLQKCNSIM